MTPWLRSVAALSVCLLAGLAAATAQPATRGITPVPFNANSPVTLAVDLDQKQPRVGSTVSVCFQSSGPGFATLWNVSTSGEATRIFPNRYSQIGPAAQIDGSKRYCAGSSNDPFRFRVDGPPGTEDVYLLWTTRTDLQPSGASYATAQALVQDMQRLGGANSTEWGAAKITYDIVPPAGPPPVVIPPPPPPPPTPQDGPKVWVLALGSNVGTLTKSNQDAAQFIGEVQKLFNIPDDRIRFFQNGRKAQFISGMAWLTNVAEPRDFVFIFYSGHGGRIRDPSSSDGWDEFLVPYDMQDPNPNPRNYLYSQQLAAQINRLQTKNVIAVIDACYSAGVYRAMQAEVLGGRSKTYQLPPEISEESVRAAFEEEVPRTRAMGGRGRIAANGLLLAAAKREQTAIETSKGSLFTLALVQEMDSREGGTLMDVFNRSVKLTEQFSNNRQDPEAVGDFELGRSVNFNK